MDQSAAERRRYRRIPVQVPVRLSTIDPEPDPETGRPCFRSTRDVCTNLSRGGLLLHTEDPLAPGRRVLLEIELPEGGGIEALGRVAWCRTSGGTDEGLGLGIEFLGGSLEQLHRLESFLSGRAPQGH